MIAPVHHGPRRLRRVGLAALLGTVACYSESFADSEGSAGMSETSTIDPTTGVGESDAPAESSTGGVAADTTGDVETSDGPNETSQGSSSSGAGSTDGGGESSDEGSSTGAEETSGESSSTGEPILGLGDLVPGDLVITEVMWNPDCVGDSCEWIEVLNTTASPVNLLDLYIRDIDNSLANQGRITTDLIVEPGALVVLARGAGVWPYEFDADAVYGPNPGLNNSEPDSVSISRELDILDETPTLPFDAPSGYAWSLSATTLDSVSNDNSLNWCLATTVLPTTFDHEYGTPGELNPGCG